MFRKKGIFAFILIVICVSTIIPGYPVSSNVNDNSYVVDRYATNESYIIDDVPYVGQETNFYCSYATDTMIFQYYGINTTLNEVLHHSGIGYLIFYNNLHFLVKSDLVFAEPSYFRYPLPSFRICQLFKFIDLASIYNLTYSFWTPDQNTCSIELTWKEYWTRVKENITKDIPIITSINTYYLPYLNVSGAHSIVVVGFNQSHIFYNDPATALFSSPEDGFYANMSLDDFQLAVNSSLATKFFVRIYNKKSDTNLNRTEIFLKAHEMNNKRLNGYILENTQSINYGIGAVKLYKRDLRRGALRRMKTVFRNWDYINQGGSLAGIFYTISIEKYNVSQYLLDNYELCPNICIYEGQLLENESKCWKNIAEHFIEFETIAKNNGYFKTLVLSNPIMNKIRKELTKIVFIEKEIIRGPYSIYV